MHLIDQVEVIKVRVKSHPLGEFLGDLLAALRVMMIIRQGFKRLWY